MTEDADDATETPVETERPHRPDGGREGADEDDPLGDLARRIREKREQNEQTENRSQRPGGTEGDSSDPTEAVGSGRSGVAGDSEDGSGDELFEEMDVSDVDTDAVWDSVLTEETEAEGSDPISPNVDIDPAVTVESTVGADHIVPKDDYCESCQYFSTPPEVACSYEDAEVVEILEAGQFRVRNCPVVEGFIDTDGSAVERADGEGISEETPSD